MKFRIFKNLLEFELNYTKGHKLTKTVSKFHNLCNSTNNALFVQFN